MIVDQTGGLIRDKSMFHDGPYPFLCVTESRRIWSFPANVLTVWLIAYNRPAKDRVAITDAFFNTNNHFPFSVTIDGRRTRAARAAYERVNHLKLPIYVELWYEERP